MNSIKTTLCMAFLLTMLSFKAFAQEELRIPYGLRGKTIYGVLHKPQQSGKYGVAIVSHGFNGTHHFAVDYCATLNALGYAVYAFDFPCGSVHSQTDNNTMNMSVLDEQIALEQVVAYFRSQKEVDKKRIVLIGESQGGLVSALTAARLQKQISKLVLIYPALCIPDNWRAQYPSLENVPDTTHIWGVPLGRRFFTEIHKMDVFKIIPQYRGPVHIIHGSADPIVPLSYSEKAIATYRNARLQVIEGAGHGFDAPQRTLSNQFVHDFLK